MLLVVNSIGSVRPITSQALKDGYCVILKPTAIIIVGSSMMEKHINLISLVGSSAITETFSRRDETHCQWCTQCGSFGPYLSCI